jgi:hypothetical protein
VGEEERRSGNGGDFRCERPSGRDGSRVRAIAGAAGHVFTRKMNSVLCWAHLEVEGGAQHQGATTSGLGHTVS